MFPAISKRRACQNLLKIQPCGTISSSDLLWNAQPLAGGQSPSCGSYGISPADQTTGTIMIQGHHSKAETQPTAPRGQQHFDNRNLFFLKLCCVQVRQSSLPGDFHPLISSDLPASLLLADESAGRYFCFMTFAFSVTGLLCVLMFTAQQACPIAFNVPWVKLMKYLNNSCS